MEHFWYSDPNVLFTASKWYKFVPTGTMSVAESLNAVVRFSVYLSALLFLSSMQPLYLMIIPLVMAVTVVLNALFPDAKRMVEGFRTGPVVSGHTGDERTRPSDDNPFMNPQLTDIHVKNNRPRADDVTKRDVREEVNRAFAKTSNIYMDTSNVFDLVQSQRNFYTVVEDDHAGLIKFLGKNARTDKLLSEGYVATKGTVPELPSTNTLPSPSGTTFDTGGL